MNGCHAAGASCTRPTRPRRLRVAGVPCHVPLARVVHRSRHLCMPPSRRPCQRVARAVTPLNTPVVACHPTLARLSRLLRDRVSGAVAASGAGLFPALPGAGFQSAVLRCHVPRLDGTWRDLRGGTRMGLITHKKVIKTASLQLCVSAAVLGLVPLLGYASLPGSARESGAERSPKSPNLSPIHQPDPRSPARPGLPACKEQ